ncbi:hypothetical protein C7G42_01390 [Bradyrhizobium sp. MOS003]|nr:hypothetical protein C7G42_01390 [Bradyrhizobium sp. MOS003]
MRTAWTPHALPASPFVGEAAVSGRTGGSPVTIDQFPAVMLNAATPPSAAEQKAAYIVVWRRRFAPI